jgi:hypothetical protein
MFRSLLLLPLYTLATGAVMITLLYLPLPFLCAGLVLFASLQLCTFAVKSNRRARRHQFGIRNSELARGTSAANG